MEGVDSVSISKVERESGKRVLKRCERLKNKPFFSFRPVKGFNVNRRVTVLFFALLRWHGPPDGKVVQILRWMDKSSSLVKTLQHCLQRMWYLAALLRFTGQLLARRAAKSSTVKTCKGDFLVSGPKFKLSGLKSVESIKRST